MPEITLAELKKKEVDLVREDLLGGTLDAAKTLLEKVRNLGAVGEGAAHCEKTLSLFVQQSESFLARTAPQLKPFPAGDGGGP